MTQAISIEEGWVDIVPPEIPAATVDPMAILLFLLLLALLLLVGFVHQRRPRQRARRALRRLARDLRHSRVEMKAACFEIRHWLRIGLGTHPLPAMSPGRSRQAAEHSGLERLDHYCFSAKGPTTAELDAILRAARAWLAAG